MTASWLLRPNAGLNVWHDLEAKYDEIKVSYGATINFLLLKYSFEEARVEVMIDVCELVQDISFIKSTPAGMNLFVVNDDENPFSAEESKNFHSTVAKFLYIAKRTRGDILIPVNFLATGVKDPNEGDLLRLKRGLQ